MSTFRSALRGMAWFAAGSWLQFVVSMLSFLIVIRHVPPTLVGAFNAGAAITAFVDMVMAPSLSLSLGQRETIEPRHVNATFWTAIVISLVLVTGIMVTGPHVLARMNAPQGWPLLMAVATVWPLTMLTSVFSSLLSREMRFSQLSRIAMLAGLLGGAASIITVVAGGGVWALVAGDMTFRVTRFCGTALAIRYRPGLPRDLAAIRDLLSFNLMTLLTLILAYADNAAPRLLTGVLLGPTALGYLSLALRAVDLLSQLTLNPVNQIMMVSVARLNRDLPAMRHLVLSVYRIATALAYPMFIAAIVLAPAIVWIIGSQWQPAVLGIQIMLLVGLRTSTGTFNTAIFQGTGRLAGLVLIIGLGLVLQILFVSIGARFGAAGVAAAILSRTIGTWPLGCWLVRKATGLPLREQLRTGQMPLIAGLTMAGAMLVTQGLLSGLPVYLALAGTAAIGAATYVGVLLGCERGKRRMALEVLGDLRSRDLAGVRRRIIAAISAPEPGIAGHAAVPAREVPRSSA